MIEPSGWPPSFIVCCFGLLGLLLGSFLNVVIHRLPIMLESAWAEPVSVQGTASCDGAGHLTPMLPSRARYNLLMPPSACPQCDSPLRWWQNLPLLSFFLQKGRCAHCDRPISWRYPLVELACAGLFAACAWHFTAPVVALAWAGYCSTLLVLALIDQNTGYLPDILTLPLLWAGLVLSSLFVTDVPLAQSVWGAALGYAIFWLISQLYQLLRKMEGIGHGDIKLLAAMGAWIGPAGLIPLCIFASVLGLISVLPQLLTKRIGLEQSIPFGPFLALAGVLMAFVKTPVLSILYFSA